MNKFVVTGCGRSGTTYMSELLSKLDISCTHEKIFPQKIGNLRNYHKLLLLKFFSFVPWDNGAIGEAAWEAAPFIKYLPKNIYIFHQVRHPLEYIKSREAKGITYFPLRNKYTPNQIITNNDENINNLPIEQKVEYLAKFWIDWNLLVEANSFSHSYSRYKMEDINSELINNILKKINIHMDYHLIEEEIESFKNKIIHSGYKKNKLITLNMLTDNTHKKIIELGNRYDYDL